MAVDYINIEGRHLSVYHTLPISMKPKGDGPTRKYKLYECEVPA
ncbi:hypothetical protein CsSME_00002686 [Camellia sinensis var. sinensis]